MGIETHSKSQCPSALGVDKEQSWDCRHDLDGTITKRSVKSLGRREIGLLKNGGTVERDDYQDVNRKVRVRAKLVGGGTYC